MLVLISEASVVVAMSVAAALEERGYRTVIANTSSAAMNSITEEKPSVAIVDLTLRGDFGSKRLVDALSQLGVPVLVTSSKAVSGHGADIPNAVFLEKPISGANLLDAVERLITKKKARA